MARKQWIGQALAVAQIDHLTPANVGIGNTFSVTINNRVVTYTATVGTVANVCAGLKALLSASQYPEFLEIAWTEDGTKIVGTSVDPGRPFVATSSASGGTATLTRSASIANSGPNDWSIASNWSDGSVPGAGDIVEIFPGKPDILYGLDQSSAGTLTAITLMQGSRVRVGLPLQNPAGYAEYRTTHLSINVLIVNVGYQNAEDRNGTSRFKLNTLTTATALLVTYCGQPESGEISAVDWIGNNTSNVVQIMYGTVSLGVNGTTKIATLLVGDTGSHGNTKVVVGAQTSVLTNMTQTGGNVVSQFAPGALNLSGGVCVINAVGTITTANIGKALLYLDSAPTITNANMQTGSSVDCSRISAGPTFTNTTIYAGSSINDPRGVITFTNPMKLAGCSLRDVQLNLGNNRSIQVS